MTDSADAVDDKAAADGVADYVAGKAVVDFHHYHVDWNQVEQP